MSIPTRPFDDSTLEPFVLSYDPKHCPYLARNVTRGEQTPENVRVTGIPSSGATLVHLLVRSYGIGAVQSHGLAGSEEAVFMTVRDVRDCLCSHAKRMYGNFTEEALAAAVYDFRIGEFCEAAMENAERADSVLIYYERFLPRDLKRLAKKVARELALSVTDEFGRYLAWEFSLDRMRARSWQSCDFSKRDAIHVHGQHITNNGQSGAWKREFTPGTVELAKEYLNEYLITFGYERSDDW